MSETRMVTLFATLLWSLLASPSWAQSEGSWVSDRNGCQLKWPPKMEPRISLLWRGQCVNGKADGNGVVEVYDAGKKVHFWEYTTTNGLTWKQGEIQVLIDLKDVRARVSQCSPTFLDPQAKTRSIVAFVPDAWEIGNGRIGDRVLIFLRDFANKECPVGRFSKDGWNTQLDVWRISRMANAATSPKELSCGFAGDPTGPLHCAQGWTDYPAARELANRVSLAIRAEETQQRTEAATRRAAEQKAAEERLRQDKRNRLNKFAAQFRNLEWGNVDRLMANPFNYESKTIGLHAYFNRMLTPTVGVFGDAIVFRDIPRGTFTEKAEILIIGQVLGNTDLELPLVGKQKVPELRFRGVYFCKQSACSEILPD